ncbi:secreted alpha beta hydrolase family protein [Cryptosporidium ryanae]|uniref:secreted alpha beta hydrolase family protein n=1 Tax=Cryptosporidium ryanae TaxID=515981 RepID=UPI00351A201D|nr:secreted alpha beta hydrolase family protein [Cryptosporidium ryanae]
MRGLCLFFVLALSCLIINSFGYKLKFLSDNNKEQEKRRKLFEKFTNEISKEVSLYEENVLAERDVVREYVPLSPEKGVEHSVFYDQPFGEIVESRPSDATCVPREVPEFYYKTSENKCYVLVLSGGANRGAWQTGVLRGLVGKHTTKYNDTIRWDVIGGVSIGGVLALAGLFHEPGDEKSYTERLWNIWSTVRQDYLSDCSMPIWKNLFKFIPQYIGSMLNPRKKPKNSICDHTPLLHYLNNTFGHLVEPYENETYIRIQSEKHKMGEQFEIKRREVLVSAVRYEDGEYVTWNSSYTSLPDLINATLASTSVPGAFSPVIINGSHYMDGGVIMNMNVEESIKACFRLGLARRQEDIVIDAIETFPDKRVKSYGDDSSQKKDITFISLLSRSYSILHSQVTGLRLLRTVLCKYPKVNLRYYFSPTNEEYQEFPKSAFDGNNLTGILNMLKLGLRKGWNNGFMSIDECTNSGDSPNIYGSELFQT